MVSISEFLRADDQTFVQLPMVEKDFDLVSFLNAHWLPHSMKPSSRFL